MGLPMGVGQVKMFNALSGKQVNLDTQEPHGLAHGSWSVKMAANKMLKTIMMAPMATNTMAEDTAGLTMVSKSTALTTNQPKGLKQMVLTK